MESDTKARKAYNRRERRAKERFDADVSFVMSTPQGRRFAWWLLGEAGIRRSVFRPNALDMAMLAGMQNMGLRLEAALMEACPEMYLKAQDEAGKNQKQELSEESTLANTPEKEDEDA